MKKYRRKNKRLLYAISLPVFLYAGYLLGYPFVCGDFMEGLNAIGNAPFSSGYWTKGTPACLFIAAGCWAVYCVYTKFAPDNFRNREEHGSARWGDVREISRRLRDKNDEDNRILSAHLSMSANTRMTGNNNNVVVIGGSGSAKTTKMVYPNIFKTGSSFIVTDPKGEVRRTTAKLKHKQGYRVRWLDLIRMEESMHYNPFVYIRSQLDIRKLVQNIFENTQRKDGGVTNSDQVWEDAAKQYLESLFMYVWLHNPPGKKSIPAVLDLMQEARVTETNTNTGMTLGALSMRFDKLDAADAAKKQYNLLVQSAGDTMRSVLFTANARMGIFESETVRSLLAYDEMELASYGAGAGGDRRTKSVLYCVIPDSDTTYNCIIGMLYTQAFQELYYQADFVFNGQLPIRVSLIFDEFANVALPDDYTKIESTMRSRNIDAMMIVQNLAQLKVLFKDAWETVTGNADALIYLGGNELETFKYVSERLGPETIDKHTYSISYGQSGGSSRSRDTLERTLMDPAEVGRLPRNLCILFVRGEYPVLDEKFNTFALKLFKRIEPWSYETRDQEPAQGTEEAYEPLSPERTEYYRRSGAAIREASLGSLLAYRPGPLPATGGAVKTKGSGELSANARAMLDYIIQNDLTAEQRREIFLAYEAGFEDDEVFRMCDAGLTVEEMRKRRELIGEIREKMG